MEWVRQESMSREARTGGVSRVIMTVWGDVVLTASKGLLPVERVTMR